MDSLLRAQLNISPETRLVLCLDSPLALSEDNLDLLGRIIALTPKAVMVLGLKAEAAADREQRKDLRARLNGPLAAQSSLDRFRLCLYSDRRQFLQKLLPLTACLLRFRAETALPGENGTPEAEQTLPLLDFPLAGGIRTALGLKNPGTPGPAREADAFVEAALNVAAPSRWGAELRQHLPNVRLAFAAADSPEAPFRLFDLNLAEDSGVEFALTLPGGQTRQCRTRGLDLRGQIDAYYGRHRSGWAYVTDGLRPLHNPAGPYFETFLERRFSWGAWMGEKLGPVLKPWVGVVHVPLQIPPWFGQSNIFTEIAKTEAWQASAPYCRGLFTLSASLRDSLRTAPELAKLPLDALLHPTEFGAAAWSPEAYCANRERALVQIGSTYRNLHAIHCVPSATHRKLLAMGGSRAGFMGLYAQEEQFLVSQGRYEPGLEQNTIFLEFLADAAYDALFTQNIIFVEYYAASATNLVLECLARNTPLLVNPLPAIVEYLGENYPLYFNSYEEAGSKADDQELVLAAHRYLADMDKSRFTREFFLNSILDSQVYRLAVEE